MWNGEHVRRIAAVEAYEMEESRLTEPEMDAALQLIQLSGDSDSGVRCNNNGDVAKRGRRDDGREESVGDTAEICSSSASASASAVNIISVVVATTTEDENLDEAEQGWLSRKRKFRSVVELYRVTSPTIKAGKRSKKANMKMC